MWNNQEVITVGDNEIWLVGAVAHKTSEPMDESTHRFVTVKPRKTILDQRLTDIFWAASDAPRRVA